jgi:stage II sporulation protein M
MKKQKTLREYYAESLRFIGESKKQIIFILIIFVVFSFIGYFTILPKEIENLIREKLNEIVAMFEGLGLLGTIWKIFSNNVYVSFASVTFGILFGIFPIITTISNGFILGYVANKAVSIGGVVILWKLLPHGVFELPAVIISLGIGLRLGLTFISNRKKLKNESLKALMAFLLILTPLLIIAAIIEGFLVYFFK